MSVNIVDDFFFFLTFLFHLVLLHWTRGGVYTLLCYIFLSTLGVPLQNDNMKAHIYFYQFIKFWNYTLIAYCSSALGSRRSVSTKMLHFLEHRPLQKNNMKTFNYYIWYIHFLYLCICYACSSVLDTRMSVGFIMLHFLNTFPLFYAFYAYPFPPHLCFLRIPLSPLPTHSAT